MGREGVLQEATKKKIARGGECGIQGLACHNPLTLAGFFFFFLLSSILQTVKYIVCKIKGIVMK